LQCSAIVFGCSLPLAEPVVLGGDGQAFASRMGARGPSACRVEKREKRHEETSFNRAWRNRFGSGVDDGNPRIGADRRLERQRGRHDELHLPRNLAERRQSRLGLAVQATHGRRRFCGSFSGDAQCAGLSLPVWLWLRSATQLERGIMPGPRSPA